MRQPERASQARTLPTADDASLTLGRRIGVLVVLVALGGAIVLAASGSGDDRTAGLGVTPTTRAVIATSGPLTGPVTTPPLVGTPTGRASFLEPESTLVNTRRLNLRVKVPDPGVPWDGLELRVLRGGTQVLGKAIGPEDLDRKGRVTLKGIPLKRGSNKLGVLLANTTGDGPLSETLTIRLDDRAPRLKVTSPRAGSTLNADSVTVRGRTVPGIRVVIRNVTTDQKVEAYADGEGRFGASVRLKRGRDTIKVAVADAAGNEKVEQFAIVRGNGKPEARLSLSRDGFRRSALPRHFDARVSVLDADGRPIKGARVVFTIAPPGTPAQIRETTTAKDGVATWSGFRVVKDAVKGTGLVTVLVTLSDGRQLKDTTDFSIG